MRWRAGLAVRWAALRMRSRIMPAHARAADGPALGGRVLGGWGGRAYVLLSLDLQIVAQFLSAVRFIVRLSS